MSQSNTDLDLLVDTLKRFDPLQNLSDAHLAQLARGATAFSMTKRQQLLGADEHRWMVFLVSGSVQSKTHDGVTETIRSRQDGQPALFDRSPRPSEVIVLEDSQLLRVDRKQFSVLMNQQIASSTLVQEIDIEADVQPLFDKIVKAYTARTLPVPLNPSSAARMIKALEGGVTDREMLSDMLRHDTSLTLHMASAVLTSENPPKLGVTRLEEAVADVNPEYLITYLKQAVAQCAWPEAGSALNARLMQANDYMRSVGQFCRLIAEKIEDVDPQRAEMAGLLSAAGVATLLVVDPEQAEQLEQAEKLDQTVSLLKGLVTELVLIQARMDPKLIKAVELATTGKPTLSQAIQLGDICRVAAEYLPVDVNGNRVQLVDDSVLITRLGRNGLGLRELDELLEKCFQAGDAKRRIA